MSEQAHQHSLDEAGIEQEIINYGEGSIKPFVYDMICDLDSYAADMLERSKQWPDHGCPDHATCRELAFVAFRLARRMDEFHERFPPAAG